MEDKGSLTRARDHVLDEIVVAGTIGVRVVSVLRSVLEVSHVDGDAAVPLLGSVVNGAVILHKWGRLCYPNKIKFHLTAYLVFCQLLLRQYFGYGRRERRFAVVHVSDCA